MQTKRYYKARGYRDEHIESVNIVFDDEVPNVKTLDDAEKTYQFDAVSLCRTLRQVLPGGTFDRLLVEMLKEKASLFKVPYRKE